jgi:hypothetical protein
MADPIGVLGVEKPAAPDATTDQTTPETKRAAFPGGTWTIF